MKSLLDGSEIPDIAPRMRRDRAHAAPPGTGPEGETCGTCQNSVLIRYHDKTYWKCGLCCEWWSHGPGTDIRLKHAACKHWKTDQLLPSKPEEKP